MHRTIWSNTLFRRLWIAQSFSCLGTSLSAIAIPLLAVNQLSASSFEMGLLYGAQFLPFALLGIPAGVAVDRWNRRHVLIVCDVARAILFAYLSFAGWYGHVSMLTLVALIATAGCFTTFFEVAVSAYLPEIVEARDLVDGNSAMMASESVASVAGPSFAGFIIQSLSAMAAILIDGISYLASAMLLLSCKRTTKSSIEQEEHTRILTAVLAGFRYIFGSPLLRALLLSVATYNFFFAMLEAVYIPFLVRDLDASTGQVGMMFACGGIGAFLGATLPYLKKDKDRKLTLFTSLGLAGFSGLLLVADHGSPLGGLWGVAIAQLIAWFSVALFNVIQVSLRQAIVPSHIIGKVTANFRTVIWGIMPLGALCGGALAGETGNALVIVVGATGASLAALWIVIAPNDVFRVSPSLAA